MTDKNEPALTPNQKDFVLINWIWSRLVWSALIVGGCSYLAFWKGQSALWYVLAGYDILL